MKADVFRAMLRETEALIAELEKKRAMWRREVARLERAQARENSVDLQIALAHARLGLSSAERLLHAQEVSASTIRETIKRKAGEND